MGTYHAPESENVEVSTIVGGEEVRIKFGKNDVSVTDEALDQILAAVAEDPRNPVRKGRKSGGASGKARHVAAPAKSEE